MTLEGLFVHPLGPLPSEAGKTGKVWRACARPESGLDCLVCAIFARVIARVGGVPLLEILFGAAALGPALPGLIPFRSRENPERFEGPGRFKGPGL